jgi:hypothetical protein
MGRAGARSATHNGEIVRMERSSKMRSRGHSSAARGMGALPIRHDYYQDTPTLRLRPINPQARAFLVKGRSSRM